MVRRAVNGHFTGCYTTAGMTGSHSAETHMSAGPRKRLNTEECVQAEVFIECAPLHYVTAFF